MLDLTPSLQYTAIAALSLTVTWRGARQARCARVALARARGRAARARASSRCERLLLWRPDL
eukprot:2069343-Prymnesium_polylepis.1